ncbi:hypothetical protein COBT_001939 [Conglomerata obtusa]
MYIYLSQQTSATNPSFESVEMQKQYTLAEQVDKEKISFYIYKYILCKDYLDVAQEQIQNALNELFAWETAVSDLYILQIVFNKADYVNEKFVYEFIKEDLKIVFYDQIKKPTCVDLSSNNFIKDNGFENAEFVHAIYRKVKSNKKSVNNIINIEKKEVEKFINMDMIGFPSVLSLYNTSNKNYCRMPHLIKGFNDRITIISFRHLSRCFDELFDYLAVSKNDLEEHANFYNSKLFFIIENTSQKHTSSLKMHNALSNPLKRGSFEAVNPYKKSKWEKCTNQQNSYYILSNDLTSRNDHSQKSPKKHNITENTKFDTENSRDYLNNVSLESFSSINVDTFDSSSNNNIELADFFQSIINCNTKTTEKNIEVTSVNTVEFTFDSDQSDLPLQNVLLNKIIDELEQSGAQENDEITCDEIINYRCDSFRHISSVDYNHLKSFEKMSNKNRPN